MQQEEDWDREGLLDPAWERQQRKVRTMIVLLSRITTRFVEILNNPLPEDQFGIGNCVSRPPKTV